MKKWEYKTVSDVNKTNMIRLGKEGWELVQVLVQLPGWFTDGKAVFIFKRELL